MARLVVKNGHQIYMCYNIIKLCAQNTGIALGSLVDICESTGVITSLEKIRDKKIRKKTYV